MYSKEHFDHLFYRMRKCIPTSSKLFFVITIMKLYPMLLLSHTGGYVSPKNELSTIHTYYKYFSLTFYMHYSFSPDVILIIIVIILVLNLILFILLLYYLSRSKKVKQMDENYANNNSLDIEFEFFSNIAFFKYIMFFQFFQEINFLPLVCIPNAIDFDKIVSNNIMNNNFQNYISALCSGRSYNELITFSAINFVFDMFFYWLLTSRFFDFNILSEYKWNFYPSFIFSFEFLESCFQVCFIFFLDYNNKKFRIIFNSLMIALFLLHIYKNVKKTIFYTSDTVLFAFVAQFIRLMCYISTALIAIFQMSSDVVPNDVNLLGLLIAEFILVYLLMHIYHRNDHLYIKNILVNSLRDLNDRNIYNTLVFLIKEFKVFLDIGYKFKDKNLDLFLEMYVNHLKICKDLRCPCKNYVKKISNTTNTVKSGYTTMINFTHMKKNEEEYILNKFFNVLASNISPILKYSNNINVIEMRDSHRQQLIYQLRIKFIIAVRKLLSYKLEKLSNYIDNELSNQFSPESKDFIRINFYAMNIYCNKSYYKTQFFFHEFLSDYFKKGDKSYRFNLIYYFYLKMFSIHEYSKAANRTETKKHYSSSGSLDTRYILSLCVKYSEIEEKLNKTVEHFKDFMVYFLKAKIYFVHLLNLINEIKKDYKSISNYINYYFKNDKINNLFICTKIILLFKVLHFDIPETLHNKLIIQIHDNDDKSKITEDIDFNYYLIINYIKGDFSIKFVSHELLLVLEYAEDDIKNKDFHVLFPEQIRKVHKGLLKKEIKSKGISTGQKEVFFIGKNRTCILFDIQYKSLLNLKGEITLLSVVKMKKTAKEFRMCFACIDDNGELLAVNREFEEFLLLSMKLLDYVKVDVEKLLLQGMAGRMRKFFRDQDNIVFQEQFDYDQYISSLFDEEFDKLKEGNEKEYKRKYARWEVLKEMNRKRKVYTKFLEINIHQRIIDDYKIYFVKYSMKVNESLRSIEPHGNPLSMINAVKISKREMAKLSFFKGEEIFESVNEKSSKEEKVNEIQDDLFESQSQISSAVTELKERNTVRLFRQKQNTFLFLQKSSNISILMAIIGVLSIVSVAFNSVTINLKTFLYEEDKKVFSLYLNTLILKKDLFSLSSAITVLSLIEDGILSHNSTLYNSNDLLENLYNVIETESGQLNIISYNISRLSTQHFQSSIDSILNKEGTLNYIFDNGLIYQKENTSFYQEITAVKKIGLDVLNKYDGHFEIVNDYKDTVIYQFFIDRKIERIQDSLSEDISLSSQDIGNFFLMNNLFETLELYLNEVIVTSRGLSEKQRRSTYISVILIKVFELLLVIIIVSIEWMFIWLGYGKTKKKMMKLYHKLDKNNIPFTIRKVNEFIVFSNTFNISSLYFIADLDLKKVEDTPRINQESNQSELHRNSNLNPPTGNSFIKKLSSNSMLNSSSNNLFTNTGGTSLIKRKEIKETLLKSFHEFKRDTDKTIQKTETEGEKNLLRVVQKLAQIRGKKPKKNKTSSSNNIGMVKLEEILSTKKEDSIIRSDVIDQSSNFDSAISNNDFSKTLTPTIPQDPLNLEKEDKEEQEIPITPILERTKYNITINMNKIDEDKSLFAPRKSADSNDSKSIIKNFSGDNNGANSKKRVPKVKFKDKNVRYYSPELHVLRHDSNKDNQVSNEIDKIKNALKSKFLNVNYKTDFNNSSLNDSVSNRLLKSSDSSRIRRNSSSKSIASSIKSNTDIGKGFGISKLENKHKSVSIRDSSSEVAHNVKDLNLYSLVEQGKAILVKKNDNGVAEVLKKEALIEKIDNVIHDNKQSRLILNISLSTFIILYCISIFFNFNYHNLIHDAGVFSNLLYNKTTLLYMIVLKYQYSLILNDKDDIIFTYIDQINENSNEIINFKSKRKKKVFPNLYKLEKNKTCSAFSKFYSDAFGTVYEDENEECSLVGDLINVKGIERAEQYLINTIIIQVEDWRKIKVNSDEEIIKLINDPTNYSIISEMEYTIWKYSTLIMTFIVRDKETLFNKIFRNEKIMSYISIMLNLILLGLSLIFIIYPIKSVEMLITWLIHKIV